MSPRVAVNGFGRIGRTIVRAAMRDGAGIELVAINDLTDAATLAHLLEHDSVHGPFTGSVSAVDGGIEIDGTVIRALSEEDPAGLPWRQLEIDIVVEATGKFTRRGAAARHLDAGARKVILTAPADDPDVTLCRGVNDDAYVPSAHSIISNASCTTHCLAPVAKVVDDAFGLRRGWMVTVHSYTNDQRVLDCPHPDLRRARAAFVSAIPTTTGAIRAVGRVLPELRGRLDGCSVRVPVPDVSLINLVAQIDAAASADEVNDAFRSAAHGPMVDVLAVSDAPLVSRDYVGDPHSAIVDAEFTTVIDSRLVHVMAWYDNEMGYATRVVDLTEHVGSRL